MTTRVPPCIAADDPWLREAVGAYLLGALEPEESDRVAAHLTACASCRAEYGELTELLPLLASVTETEAVNGPVRPEPAVLGRVLETASRQAAGDGADPALDPDRPGRRQPARERHGSRYRAARPSLRGRIAIAAAGLVAAAGAGAGVMMSGGSHASAVPGSWNASASAPSAYGTAITASVEVSPASWGSTIQLKMAHVPVGYTCTMVVVGTSGTPVVAGNWKASAEEAFTIPGSVSLAPDRIASIEVDLPNGSTLLTLNRPR